MTRTIAKPQLETRFGPLDITQWIEQGPAHPAPAARNATMVPFRDGPVP
jgi:hypothetical protein